MSTVATLDGGRQGELWRRLRAVTDPELDESIVDMGFVERADILADGTVVVDFRLPTYWCSPNFVFLMLEDVRAAVEGLSWAPPHRLTLHDHMFAEDVNAGLAAGRSFPEIFGALAVEDDLSALRAKFREKAFKRRQETVLLDLRRTLTDATLLTMDLAALAAARPSAGPDDAIGRYLEAVALRWPGCGTDAPAFRSYEGAVLGPADLDGHLADLRAVRINMEFSGALCRGLKGTRYKEVEMVDGEPTLVDFILDRVPPRGCAGPSAHTA